MLSLETGTGFWDPIVWIGAFVIAFLIAYIIRGFGKKDFKEGTEQTKSFLSGNPEMEKDQMHIQSSNIYWGFTEVLKPLYKTLQKMHTGNVNDYVLWFLIIMAIFLIIVGVV